MQKKVAVICSLVRPEEKQLIENVAGKITVPSRVIGSGLNVQRSGPEPRKQLDVPDSYALYAGRIDRNKGVDTLFRYFLWLAEEWPECPPLLLVGHPVLADQQRQALDHGRRFLA